MSEVAEVQLPDKLIPVLKAQLEYVVLMEDVVVARQEVLH